MSLFPGTIFTIPEDGGCYVRRVKWARTLVAALAAVTFPLGLALAVYLTSAESMPTVPQPVSAASASVSRTPAVPSSRDDKGGGRTGDSAPTVTSGGGGGSSSGGGGGSDSSGGGHGSDDSSGSDSSGSGGGGHGGDD